MFVRYLNFDPANGLRQNPVDLDKVFVQNNGINTLRLKFPFSEVCLIRFSETGDCLHSDSKSLTLTPELSGGAERWLMSDLWSSVLQVNGGVRRIRLQ
jgi:hypothetical protein